LPDLHTHEGTYQDFLDRVGWKSEITESQNSKGQNDELSSLTEELDIKIREFEERLKESMINGHVV